MSQLIPVTFREIRLLEGPLGAAFLEDAPSVSQLIEACFGAETALVLLYPENLPPQFFDLSSGVAGAVLQKLANYHIRLAVVRTASLQVSSHFDEMLADQKPWGLFRLSVSRADPLNWLCSG